MMLLRKFELARIFELHGRFCAGYPFEVIVAIFTLTACMLNIEPGNGQAREGGLFGASHCYHNRCDNDVSNIILTHPLVNT